MRSILNAGGVICILLGLVLGVVGKSLLIVLGGVFCGLVLLALARLLEETAEIKSMLAGMHQTSDRIDNVIRNSPAYPVEGEGLILHPNGSGSPIYPIIQLDGEAYIRAHAFMSYLSQDATTYLFRLPGQEPVRLAKADAYYPGAKLFGQGEQVIVLLKAIGLEAAIDDGKALLKRLATS